MQNLAHFAVLTWPGPPPTPHPFPAQTTRKLTMEVATTSQMLFCNIISKWFLFLAKISIWLCSGFSVAQNGNFCDEVQAPSDFSYTTSSRCWHTRALAWTNFGWLYRQGGGGVSTSTTCSVAVIEVHQPKLWSLDFKFAPTTSLRTDGSSAFCSILCMFLLLPAQLRAYCVRSANVGC
jgi:hypothetical protein